MNRTDSAKPDAAALSRRGFIALAGITAGGRAFAGPFEPDEGPIPADKKLSPEWVRSLFERGRPQVYSGAALRHIGMPVGGIGAGMLYLGGDGRLWLWDVMNLPYGGDGGGPHYAHPMAPDSPLDCGFTLQAGQARPRALDATGFADVRFRGEYPIGTVTYADPGCALTAKLEAFSPFVPLDEEASSLPATVMRWSVHNPSKATVTATVTGRLQNAVCLHTGGEPGAARINRVVRSAEALMLEATAQAGYFPAGNAAPTTLFADFEGATYGDGWTAEGDAFGAGPVRGTLPNQQRVSGFEGAALVNSYQGGDDATGRLVSPPFTIGSRWIRFLIGGGDHPGHTCVNLVVDGAVVRTATGRNSEALLPAGWDVTDLKGRTARIEIVDSQRGPWGHILVDSIEFADGPRADPTPLADRYDYGSMALALVAPRPADTGRPAAASREPEAHNAFDAPLTGSLTRTMRLAPGASATAEFVIAWHFPNLTLDGVIDGHGRHYATRFASATAVANHVASVLPEAWRLTSLWRDTWYESTLPYWFLDRTMANTSTLATTTSYRLRNGRFYAWEGIQCCAGTCTHVWHYAHAPGRLFPALERDARERVDYGIGFDPATGIIDHRGEFRVGPATDGQCGCILRVWREHCMTRDSAFLSRVWPRVKRSIEWLMENDQGHEGLIEGAQHNTLDAEWYGQVSWLSSLYLAALRAGEEMARVMGDAPFADECRRIFERGRVSIMSLYNGEYFIQKGDPAHMDEPGSYGACEIDQVFGQAWAFQAGLGRILPAPQTRSALGALWKYNFAPDVGPWRQIHKPGRWYAVAGEAGLVMAANPSSPDADLSPKHWTSGYFNECMSGFEHQVAGHMIAEGMLVEGLAIERAIHDRYDASRRNPWNEVECSDHYARAMASYGVFLSACGYEHNGPANHIGFAPKVSPGAFRAPFTAAGAWGTYSQARAAGRQVCRVAVKHGTLHVRTAAFGIPPEARPAAARWRIGSGAWHDGNFTVAEGGRFELQLPDTIAVEAGQELVVSVG